MNWLAIVVFTTIEGFTFANRIPAQSKADCEMAAYRYVSAHEDAWSMHFYVCEDVGSIVGGGK